MVTPPQLLRRHFDDVLMHLKGALDGDPDSVHQARIATRRLRAVLPLVDNANVERAAGAVRTAGRQLGRVRELDVIGNLLLSMSDRLPHTAATEITYAASDYPAASAGSPTTDGQEDRAPGSTGAGRRFGSG
jgi:CHAD domain-containing protein